MFLENLDMGDTEIMVPMTNTLLVRGKMVDSPLLVELGGGVLMEKSVEGITHNLYESSTMTHQIYIV